METEGVGSFEPVTHTHTHTHTHTSVMLPQQKMHGNTHQ